MTEAFKTIEELRAYQDSLIEKHADTLAVLKTELQSMDEPELRNWILQRAAYNLTETHPVIGNMRQFNAYLNALVEKYSSELSSLRYAIQKMDETALRTHAMRTFATNLENKKSE